MDSISKTYSNVRSAEYLMVAFAACIFVPSSVQVEIASLQVRPMHLVGGLILVSSLLNRSVGLSLIDALAASVFVTKFISVAISVGADRAAVPVGRELLDVGSAYIAGRMIASNHERLEWFLRLLIKCFAIMSVTIIIESIVRWNIHYAVWGLIWPVRIEAGKGIEETRFGLMRAMGWTRHPIMLGMSYATLAASALAFTLRSSAPRLSRIGFFGILAGVGLSLSSGSWSTAAIGMGLVVFDRRVRVPGRKKWSIVGLVVLGTYLGTKLFASNPPMMVLMYRMDFGSGGWIYRWQLWERVTGSMGGHWIWGYGERPPEEFTRGFGWSIDNNYLVALLYGGMANVVCWLALNIVSIWRNMRSAWFAPDATWSHLHRTLGFSLVALMLGQLSVAMFSTGAVMLWLFIGLSGSSAACPSTRSALRGVPQRIDRITARQQRARQALPLKGIQ